MYGFKDIVGNDETIKRLETSINKDTLSHAYLFLGGEGLGKDLMAKSFAKAIMCKDKKNGDSCGVCDSCASFESLNHPDMAYVLASKTKAISVNDIREQIGTDINIKPFSYPNKIYIISDADTMTVQAQNALLKTLEDPPKYAVIMLLAKNRSAFLKTILSRVISIRLSPLSDDEVIDFLVEKTGMDNSNAEIFGRYAKGSIGKALKIYETEEFIKLRDDICQIFNDIGSAPASSASKFLAVIEKYKGAEELFEVMYLFVRDAFAFKKTEDIRFVTQRDKLSNIKTFLQYANDNALSNILSYIWQAKRDIEQNANFQLAIWAALIKIKGELR